jgi:hypothetical protein
LLLAGLLGILLGALLVTLTFMTARFGEIPGYLITGTAAIGAGHLVGLVAGRREVPVASLSTVIGALLVALIFFQQATFTQGGLDSSNPLTLIFLSMPLAILAVGGGWLAELACRAGSRAWPLAKGGTSKLARGALPRGPDRLRGDDFPGGGPTHAVRRDL